MTTQGTSPSSRGQSWLSRLLKGILAVVVLLVLAVFALILLPIGSTPPEQRALATLEVSARPRDALHWTLTARLTDVRDGADVRIETRGPGSLGGNATQHLSAPGAVEWVYTLGSPLDGAVATVTRGDTGGCTRVAINLEEVRIVATPNPLGPKRDGWFEPVEFTALVQGAPDAARWDWDFGDGAKLTDGGPAPQHAYTKSGQFTVQAVLYDQAGKQPVPVGRGEMSMRVQGVVEVTATPAMAAPGSAVKFSAQMPGLPKSVTWQWDFEDSSAKDSGGAAVSHAFAREGEYTVTVRALDASSKPPVQVGAGFAAVRVGPSAASTPAPGTAGGLRSVVERAVATLGWQNDGRDELQCGEDMSEVCAYRHYASQRGQMQTVVVTIYVNRFDSGATAASTLNRTVSTDPAMYRVDRSPYRQRDALRIVLRTDPGMQFKQRTYMYVVGGATILSIDSILECRDLQQCPDAAAPRPVPTREMDAVLDAATAAGLVPRDPPR